MIRRLPHPTPDRLAWAQLGAYLLICTVVVVGFLALSHTNQKLCDTTNANREYIRLVLVRSLKTLPTIAYYRERPKELADAIDQTNQTLRALPPDPCG